MSLVYAAIVPHSPLLIPTIGKEHQSQLPKTLESLKKLQEDLYVSKVETVIIISPHGSVQNAAFTINLNPEFEANLEQFGDFSTRERFLGDVGLAYQIRERLETRAPLQLISEPSLDYGSFIPLHILAAPLHNIQIIPLYYSNLDLESHFSFGQLLKREVLLSKKRIAIIASADLSHRLTKDAPGGYSPKAEKFDNRLIELLQKGKTYEVLTINPDLIHEAGECGLKSIVILLGLLDGIKAEPKKLSYEAPFGIGYLTMRYEL